MGGVIVFNLQLLNVWRERDLIRPFGAPSPKGKGEVNERTSKIRPSPLEKVARRAG